MKLYFAGAEDARYAQVAIDAGATAFLQSAFYLNYKKVPNAMNAEHYLLDSGGFTARKQGKIISVEKYAQYINDFNVKMAFNLDTSDVDETLQNQTYLERNTKAYIIPVYHMSDYFDLRHRGLLDTFAKNYPYISIGGTVEASKGVTKQKIAFLDYCYSRVGLKVKVHGLGITSYKLMVRYPWYSVDSTSWVTSEIYGKYFEFTNGKFISFTSVKVTKKLQDHRQLVDPGYRFRMTAKAFVKGEKFITDSWAARGVKWNDEAFR